MGHGGSEISSGGEILQTGEGHALRKGAPLRVPALGTGGSKWVEMQFGNADYTVIWGPDFFAAHAVWRTEWVGR